jgi:hypothetical protein
MEGRHVSLDFYDLLIEVLWHFSSTNVVAWAATLKAHGLDSIDFVMSGVLSCLALTAIYERCLFDSGHLRCGGEHILSTLVRYIYSLVLCNQAVTIGARLERILLEEINP